MHDRFLHLLPLSSSSLLAGFLLQSPCLQRWSPVVGNYILLLDYQRDPVYQVLE